MMKYTTYFFLATVLLASCGTKKQTEETENVETETIVENKISVTKAPASPEFPDAQLVKSETSPMVTANNDSVQSSKVDYQFNVENFELGVQTEDAATRGIANSGKGQHIHFIVNNGPYSAHYMPGINDNLEPGNYTVLAFLSRSYHESVKSPGAYHIENLTVGDVEPKEVDLQVPHLFFSRPKGTYSGADAETVMLDFYLVNCDLSPNGFNVRATINGEQFLLDDWAPYYMKGLPSGEVTIKLELLDESGELVDSPFNPVERKVTLEK